MNLSMNNKAVRSSTYLGDAVYMTQLDDLSGVWLFTTNGIEITNEIYFELQVWEAMIREYGRAHPKADSNP